MRRSSPCAIKAWVRLQRSVALERRVDADGARRRGASRTERQRASSRATPARATEVTPAGSQVRARLKSRRFRRRRRQLGAGAYVSTPRWPAENGSHGGLVLGWRGWVWVSSCSCDLVSARGTNPAESAIATPATSGASAFGVVPASTLRAWSRWSSGQDGDVPSAALAPEPEPSGRASERAARSNAGLCAQPASATARATRRARRSAPQAAPPRKDVAFRAIRPADATRAAAALCTLFRCSAAARDASAADRQERAQLWTRGTATWTRRITTSRQGDEGAKTSEVPTTGIESGAR